MVIGMISLSAVANLGGDPKLLIMLPIIAPCLFRLTPQDERAAARPKSSELHQFQQIESSCWFNTRLTNTNKNDGVAQPNEQTDTTINETTTFHDDGPVVVKEYPRYVSIGESFRDTAIDSKVHDLKSFLGRPILCATGTWSVTDAAKTQLQTIPLPSACLSTPSYAEKIRGFYGFRAKMVCRVQVNSQRFQQGRLLLHYLPQTAAMKPARKACALSHLMLITQQPRVDYNLNEDTEVRLEIPYVSTSMYYNMMNGDYDFGTFYLTVYSPLKTGAGSTTCSYSVWCHFEDVEVAYPTVSQSGIKIGRGRGGKSTGKVDVTDGELEGVGLGSISGFMARASKSASILSEIPLISAFTAPTSWALGVLGRAADSLGFSKPVNAGPSKRVTLGAFAYMNNTNAVDNSVKMAVRSDNQVGQLPGFAGTDIDEMDINYLIGIPCYIDQVPWTTAQATGTALSSTSLGPAKFNAAANAVSSSITYPLVYHSPMSYFANIFQYFRGSLVLTLKIVKTEFHSGRLQVEFYPGLNVPNTTATMANSQYVFREVIDLRTSSEVTITFPYTSLTPYMNTTDSFGLVAVRVINPLVAPENLSTSCQIIQEWSAAPDFEFAVPIPARQAPIIFSPQSGGMSSGSGSMSIPGHELGHVVDNKMIMPSLQPALYCIGERIQSIRQLTKRFTSFWAGSTVRDPVMAIDPQTHYLPTLTITGGPVVLADMKTDMLSYFGSLYRFNRGATRFKIIDPSNMGSCLTAQVRVGAGSGDLGPVFFGAVQPKGCCDQPAVFIPSLTGGAEIEMPYYNSTHVMGSRYTSGVGQAYVLSPNDNPLLLQVTQGAQYSTYARVYRAAGDDYSLGFFIGTIPTCSSTVFNPATI